MRLVIAASALLVGCHPGELRSLGHRVWSLHGGTCQNRVIYEDGGDTPRIAVFAYDDGHLTSYRETDGDTVMFAMTRTYDARGRRVHQVEDMRNLGAEHRVADWTYDDRDRVVRVTTDFDGELRDTRYVYRRDGRLDRRVESDGVVRFRYRGRDPLVIDELHDGWGWRYTFAAGRWLIRTEDLDADGHASRPTIYTYDDLATGRLARRDFDLDVEGVPSEIDRYTWEDGRVVRAAYGTQTVDLDYDDGGRIVSRRWADPAQAAAYATTYAWSGAALRRVERRASDGELIEGWTFDRGCWGDLELSIPLAPVSSWDDDLDPIGFGTDLRTWWGFPDVL